MRFPAPWLCMLSLWIVLAGCGGERTAFTPTPSALSTTEASPTQGAAVRATEARPSVTAIAPARPTSTLRPTEPRPTEASFAVSPTPTRPVLPKATDTHINPTAPSIVPSATARVGASATVLLVSPTSVPPTLLPAETLSPTASPLASTPTLLPPTATPEPSSTPTASETPATGTLPPNAAEIAVPAGFRVWRWAEGLPAPTALEWGEDGQLYMATYDGAVVSIADRDGDGRAEPHRIVASGVEGVLGLARRPGVAGVSGLYVSRYGGVDRLVDGDGDGVAERREKVFDGLPVGRHSTDDVAFGPDGWLYVATGSVDDRGETGLNPALQASIVRVPPDGGGPEQYASGLRNPYGLAFDRAGRLWATDNGGDEPEGQPDELNLIRQGGDYGWPGCYGNGQEYIEDRCAGTIAPVALLAPHSSSDGLTVYEATNFPAGYRGGIFVAQWGSAFVDKPAGRALVFIRNPTGAASVETFATGFLHPLDVKIDPRDGGLIVADFGDNSPGVLYKIVWSGEP